MERLRDAGLTPIVVTNQPDVARGLIAPQTLVAMHERLAAALPVLDIFVCTHDSSDACACRKPKPGMLEAAAVKWNIDLQRSFMVGDRASDVEAGRAAGPAREKRLSSFLRLRRVREWSCWAPADLSGARSSERLAAMPVSKSSRIRRARSTSRVPSRSRRSTG